jgi:hypothetical protein
VAGPGLSPSDLGIPAGRRLWPTPDSRRKRSNLVITATIRPTRSCGAASRVAFELGCLNAGTFDVSAAAAASSMRWPWRRGGGGRIAQPRAGVGAQAISHHRPGGPIHSHTFRRWSRGGCGLAAASVPVQCDDHLNGRQPQMEESRAAASWAAIWATTVPAASS